MFIKYSPIKFNEYTNIQANPETTIQYINDYTISVDGEVYEFDIESIQFPDIFTETEGIILEAHRDGSNELYITIRRFYSNDCSAWDNGTYWEINK